MIESTPETHPYLPAAESHQHAESTDPPIVDLDELQQRATQDDKLGTEVDAATTDDPVPPTRTLHADSELYGDDFIPPYKLRRLARQREQGKEAEQHAPVIHPETVRLVTEVASSPKLYKYLRSRIGSASRTATAEDIAQEVIMAVLRKYAKAPPEEDSSIWPFVFGVAANKVADHYRDVNRRKEDLVDELPDVVTARATTDTFWRQWDRQRVREVMTELATTDDKKVMVELLLSDEELDSKERGEILGMSGDTARVKEYRFRAEARKKFEARFAGEEIAFGYFVPKQRTPLESPNRKKKSAPKLPMSQVCDNAGEALYAACAETIARGEPELSAHIPVYLGAWSTALFALDRLRDADDPRPSAIIFPHERLLPAFHAFVEARLGQTASYFIQTPEAIADWPDGHALEHVVVPGDIDEGLKERLRAHSSFILWLLDKKSLETTPKGSVFCAPSYRSVGGRSTVWEYDDSVRYLQEWRFATGDEMTQTTARMLGNQGGGPTLPRLLKGMQYGKFTAEAGYPPTPKAE